MKNLHFVHGNGFTSGCYRQMLGYLEQDFICYSLDKVGHNDNFPISDNWDYLVDEVLENLANKNILPVVAVGHSLGGVLSLLAAIKKPEYFKAVILLDSPILGKFKSFFVKISKKFGFIDSITPAGQTKNRKHLWRDRQEVWEYLKTKALFKNFTNECLNDYIDYGLEKIDNSYQLKFDKGREYNIFRTIPHNLPSLKGKLKVPTALIYGELSKVINDSDRRYMQKHFNILLQKVSGSHMFPMEYPKETAQIIIDLVKKLEGE